MSSGPIWARSEPGERRASLTREQIAHAAIALADAEGPKALSMRRLARELDVGTMTLYGYVKTKAELFALVDDTIMGGLVVPEDEFPDDWRGALEAISERSRANFAGRPWILEAMGALGNRIGPNALRHFDQTMRAVSGLDLSNAEKLDITSLVDEYVFGYAVRAAAQFGPGDDDWEHMQAYANEQIETGDYPYIEAMFATGPEREAAWAEFRELEQDENRFRRGLARLLDGIEADLQRRGVL